MPREPGLLARLASRSARICDQLSRGPDVGQQRSLKEVGVGRSALRRSLLPPALPLKPSMQQVWGEPLKPSMQHVLEAVRGPCAGLWVQVMCHLCTRDDQGLEMLWQVSGTTSLRIPGHHPGWGTCRVAKESFLHQVASAGHQ